VSWRLGNSIRLWSQNRFASLENLTDSEDINRAWGNIKENIKTPDKESLCLYVLNVEVLKYFN
jgi:hypothetical protein